MKTEKEQTLLRIPEKLKNELRKRAEDKGITLNALITQMLWEYLEKN